MRRRDAISQSPSSPPPPPPSGALQSLLDSLPSSVMVVDETGVVRYAGGQLHLLFHWSYEDLVGQLLVDHVEPADRAAVQEMLWLAYSAREGQVVGPLRVGFSDCDATSRLTEVWVMNRLADASVSGYVVLMLPESAYLGFGRVLEAIVANDPLEKVFDALARALRLPPVSGESYFSFMGGDDRGVMRVPRVPEVPGPPLRGPWEEVWQKGGTLDTESLESLPWTLKELAREAGFRAVTCFGVKEMPDGRAGACLVVWRREEGPMSAFALAAARRAAAIATLAISRSEAALDEPDAVLRDPLTGLANRDSFCQVLEERVRAGPSPVVLCIGLDDFSDVNERLGRLAGDAVLRVTARRLVSVTRPNDQIARLGGDEFAVLCEGSISEHQIVRIAARVVGQLSKPLSVGDGETLDVGASIGIALNLPAGTPADTVLSRADRALVEAKAKGKRQWVLAEVS